jgi:hypothetical protein
MMSLEREHPVLANQIRNDIQTVSGAKDPGRLSAVETPDHSGRDILMPYHRLHPRLHRQNCLSHEDPPLSIGLVVGRSRLGRGSHGQMGDGVSGLVGRLTASGLRWPRGSASRGLIGEERNTWSEGRVSSVRPQKLTSHGDRLGIG